MRGGPDGCIDFRFNDFSRASVFNDIFSLLSALSTKWTNALHDINGAVDDVRGLCFCFHFCVWQCLSNVLEMKRQECNADYEIVSCP